MANNMDKFSEARQGFILGSRYEKFSERARRVLILLAQEEAQRLNHNYISTEHILLGLVRETEGVAARALSSLTVDLSKVRFAVEFIIGRGEKPPQDEIGLTPRPKKVMELAVDEARRMNHTYIGTEHLLIGLLREGEGVAAGVLESLGVSLDKVRSEVHRILWDNPGEPEVVVKPSVRTVLIDAVITASDTKRQKELALAERRYEEAAELRDRELRENQTIDELLEQWQAMGQQSAIPEIPFSALAAESREKSDVRNLSDVLRECAPLLDNIEIQMVAKLHWKGSPGRTYNLTFPLQPGK